jgi:hypothetical protein
MNYANLCSSREMQPNTQVINEHKLGETMKQIQPMSSKKNLKSTIKSSHGGGTAIYQVCRQVCADLVHEPTLENIMAMSFDLGQGRRTE